jgi:hypothetical protein
VRFIPSWLHGMLDYPLAILLIALPWLGGFADGGPAQWLPVGAGVVMLVMSAMTAYEMGLVRVIPLPVHLGADALLGTLLAASPWLFNFSEVVWLPHLLLGLGEVGASLMTQTRPGHRLAHFGRAT